MKPIRTLIFILSVIVILGAGWYFFPAEGLAIGGLNLRFPSYADDSHPKQAEVDVDDVLSKVNQSFEMTVSDNLLDSMRFFRNYLKNNPNRIYLPKRLSETVISKLWFTLLSTSSTSTSACLGWLSSA